MSETADYRNFLENDVKVYVEVNADYKNDGTIIPRSFVWEDGNRYPVDAVFDVRPAASLKAGGAGLRYTVRVGGRRDVFMFLEENRGVFKWFMERRI